ncbi:MAG TPA: GNAT family N-acetyltransferase [Candidatus Eisenbacteria bacterium]|nr:GNAT family N-acetyltransferase [Candidatus Eisenbacteria bacterium]
MKCVSCPETAIYECVVCGKPLCPKHTHFRAVCTDCTKRKERLSYRIRTLNAAGEEETVRELVKVFWGEDEQLTFGRKFLVSSLPAYAAEVYKRVVGFVAFAPLGDALLVVALGVVPEYQNCGIGRRLIMQVKQEAGRLGKKKLLVSTSNDDLPALAFYQREGFQIFAVKPNVIAEKHGRVLAGIGGLPIRDELRMRRIL